LTQMGHQKRASELSNHIADSPLKLNKHGQEFEGTIEEYQAFRERDGFKDSKKMSPNR